MSLDERVPAKARWLPFLGLLLALSTMFPFVGERGYFYRAAFNSQLTAKNMALAANLSAQRGFLFIDMRRAADGTVRYQTYHRFPIGSYVLVKLAMLPFDGDFSAQLVAARALMLAFFCAAAVLAYLALARLTGSRAVALGATLLAFSSRHLLDYSDAVSNETSVDLFAVMLVFHGMVLFKAEGAAVAARRRFWQLAARVCVALLLGWHVYGLLLPFLALGAAAEAASAWRGAIGSGRPFAGRLGAVAAGVLRGRSVLLGALALLFGAGVLGCNVAREHAAHGGQRAVLDLPSVRSALRRTGVAPQADVVGTQGASDFLQQQFHRVGAASVPFALAAGADFDEFAGVDFDEFAGHGMSGRRWLTWLGLFATAGCFAGLALFRGQRAPPAALALAGFGWALLAPGQVSWTDHQLETMFHVGVPLCLFAALLLAVRRLGLGLGRERAAVVCAAVGMCAFAVSSIAVALQHLDGGEARTQRARLAEFDAVAKTIRGANVWVAHRASVARFKGGWPPSPRPHILDFLTAGSFVHYKQTLDNVDPEAAGALDFVLAFERYPIPALLTPNHRFVFLYRGGENIGGVLEAMRDGRLREYRRLAARTPVARAPTARSGFDVHVVPREETARGTGELAYLKAPCGREDTKGWFFLRLVRADAHLPWAAPSAFTHHAAFPFEWYGVVVEGKCVMRLPLPTWPVANVYTGQVHPAGGAANWRVAFRLDVDRLREAFQTVRGETPAARGDFDLHVRRGLLLYARAPCAAEDVQRRFFLHVVPAAATALPEARRARGFDNLDFDFAEHGALVDGACVATVKLPDYDIATVRTGQFDADGEVVWQVGFAPR